MKKIGIIDYFSGNVYSVTKAFEHFGCKTHPVTVEEEVKSSDFLVLPGVGAFGDGIKSLEKKELVQPIIDFVKQGRPFLGICLGMQLLFSSSEEFGCHRGLDIIKGKVLKLPANLNLKVPNIGWHPLSRPEGRDESFWKSSIFRTVSNDCDMYFIHSFAGYPDDPSHWLSRTLYGKHWFCSAVQKENVIGCQFHPEKSGEAGLEIIRNFLE